MKVVGIGSPARLRLRVKPCEVGVWRDVLCDHVDAAVRMIGEHGGRPRDGESVGGRARERAETDVAAVSGLLEQLRAAEAADQPYVLAGPTPVVDPIIRNVASEAVERLSTAVDIFRGDAKGTVTPDEVRRAADTAGACTATLIWLVDVQDDASGREEVQDVA